MTLCRSPRKGRIRPWRGPRTRGESVRGQGCGRGTLFSPGDSNPRIHTQRLKGRNTKIICFLSRQKGRRFESAPASAFPRVLPGTALQRGYPEQQLTASCACSQRSSNYVFPCVFLLREKKEGVLRGCYNTVRVLGARLSNVVCYLRSVQRTLAGGVGT